MFTFTMPYLKISIICDLGLEVTLISTKSAVASKQLYVTLPDLNWF